MKTIKKILALSISLVILLACMPAIPVFAVTCSGTCGDNVTWSLDTESGVLTISGSGSMTNYSYSNSNSVPWYSQKGYIKSVNIENGVISIGSYAFQYCSSLASITIPDSVASIGDGAFNNCSSLASITIPDSVTSIGDGAFNNCSSLASITIPDSVISIGSYAFQYCSSLASITIPNSVTSIGDGAFNNCDSLTSITIPDSVASIGEWAFSWCNSLTSITIPNSVTSIGDYAFNSCDSLTNITIPNGVASIGDSAFRNCDSLTSITIPDSVTSIGYCAFYGCSSLTSITIPNGVASIGGDAFYLCDSLTSITIPDSVTSIGQDAFYKCSNLKKVNITDISKWCEIDFKGVSSNPLSYAHNLYLNGTKLTDIIISKGVKSISDYAFYKCSSLTSITIPDSVTSIGEYAFYYCDALETVYYCGTEADWNEISISFSNDSLTNATRIYHNYSSTTTPPTCTENGYTTYTCSICGNNYTDELSALGHNYSSTTTPPTCTENGYTTYTCSICGNNYTDELSALGHNYSEEFTIDKEATDFETGIKSRHCSRCDSVTEVTVIPKTLIASGNCGENALWAVRENGTLIISGSGTVKNYGTYASVPWYIYSADIISVEIGEEITAVGHYAFNSLKNLKTVKCGNPDIDFNKLYVFGISDMVFYSLGGGEVEKYTNAKGYTLVKPENPRTPIAPTLLYKNATSITLLHIDGYEYSIDGVNYQKSNVFDNLLPNSVYTFYQRIADDVYKASVASEGLVVSTTEMPSKPKIESITDNTVVIGAVDGYEYSFDLINWQSSNVFTNLEYDKKYSFYTRTASQDTIPCPTPSEPQEVVIASAPEIKLIGATKIVVKYIDGYEYSVDGIIWQSSNMFDKLIPDFEYTIYQRYAGCEFHSTGTQIITNGQDVNTNPSSDDLVSLKKELLSADKGNNLCYDYNADGEIDIRDLVRLKKFLAGVDVPLGSTENTETQTLELLSNPAYLEQKNTVV